MDMEVELDGLFHHNTTYNYYEDYEYKEDIASRGSEAVLIPFLFSVVLAVGLLGNGLLLAVLCQKRQTWSISDTFILNLSIADILLLVTLPLWAAQAAQNCEWCFKVPLCKISGAIFNINFYCGICLLVCISYDHYLSIPYTTQKKPKLTCITFVLVWVFSLLLTIPYWDFLAVKRDPEWEEKTLCIPNCYLTQWNLISRLLHHVLGFLLPAVTLIACCSGILLRLQHKSNGQQMQRATVVILALVVVFFLCWMPYNITLIVDTFRSKSKVSKESGNSESPLKTALMVTSALACVHACLRPLLYLCLCENVRKRTLVLLRCKRDQSNGSLLELSHEREELKQTSVAHQALTTQC
ncbi:hypothetical protein PAMA_015366 [Pampus argenteus]